ncbi:hypothetical protein CRYUN_Cryun08bG0062300 [Craigia yunnanensis]
MSKDKGKKKVYEEEKVEEAEDWCFVCKDGGTLLLCDYKGCGKAYHPVCVRKKKSILKSEGRWTCSRHSCSVCGGPPRFYCLCCPDAVCRLCARSAEFVLVKLKKGLCETCLELALLAEKNAEFDSHGDKLDFEDPDTEEFMFKDYLKIIMEKEDLTFDDLHRAQFMGENYDDSSDSDKIEDKDAVVTIPDGDCDPDFAVIDNSFGKRKKSQKKLVQKNKIYNLLEAHFADTSGQSSSDENENDSGSCSGIEEEQIMAKWKRQRTLTTDKVPLEKKVAYAVQKSYYASIVAENIKLMELEQKAKSLHEDVTKNWIQRELVRLQNKIDFAHEKGRRYMLERFLDEREMLKKSSEQQRLLQKFPRVIAEEIELDPTAREESNCSTGLCKLLCPTDNHADGGA